MLQFMIVICETFWRAPIKLQTALIDAVCSFHYDCFFLQ